MSTGFPLSGVIGIVATSRDEIDLAVDAGLGSVEVRADLLLQAGMSTAALIDTVAYARQRQMACLFTARHPSHGGVFDGSEDERVALALQALAADAQLVDAEWGSAAARRLLSEGAPMILSHHDFEAMPDPNALRSLTVAMSAVSPAAIKIVPTASCITDAVRMLQWVQEGGDDGPQRIGFAMGVAGACSRVLTIAYGAPISYASFAGAVAPGQVPLKELVEIYRAANLNENTRVYGIVAGAKSAFSTMSHRPGVAARGINAVCVLLQTDNFQEIVEQLDALRLDGLSVTTPFKEQAFRIADEADVRSRRCGAADTLLIRRAGGQRRILAFCADSESVPEPLQDDPALAEFRANFARGRASSVTDPG